MSEADYVKMRGILVPQSENRKNIRYLATSLVSGKSRRVVSHMKLPELEPLDNIDQIHPSKINNFYTVVSAVCSNIPGDGEEECRGVSTDEDEGRVGLGINFLTYMLHPVGERLQCFFSATL